MYSCDAKAEFWAPFPQSSVSHDPSEIILILYADLVPKKHVFIIISVENCVSYARQQIWYHMHTKTVFYMHAKHVRIIYTPKSIFFVSIPRVFVFIWHTIYTHFHEHFRAHIYLKGVIHLFQHSLMKRKLETTAFIFFRNRNRKNVFIVTFDQLIMSLLNKSINKNKKSIN